MRTDWKPVENAKYGLQLSSPGDFPRPLASISQVTLVLLQPLDNTSLVVVVYWQLPGGGFQPLGYVSNAQPSCICSTGFADHEQIEAADAAPNCILSLGAALETTIPASLESTAVLQTRATVARKIAEDLFNFMQSFVNGTGSSTMTVPTNVFDRWIARFENRLRRDPHFFLKEHDG